MLAGILNATGSLSASRLYIWTGISLMLTPHSKRQKELKIHCSQPSLSEISRYDNGGPCLVNENLNTHPVLNEQLIAETMLPGLRCLKVDMEAIATDHQEVVAAMIRDYQSKLEAR